MTASAWRDATLSVLDEESRALVRLAAVVAGGSEAQLREVMDQVADRARAVWVEEVILQSYLFAGFPRALNAMREWRRASGIAAPPADETEEFGSVPEWRARGEATCAVVYGPFYERLRHNIHALHPALDAWMIVDGYGKVLSRPALDLRLRELCVVGACALARQDRQLHSHLHGALHAGASPEEVYDALECIRDLLGDDDTRRYRHLLARVLGK
jgi:4-carboxymuconolactone decarboxylase